MNDYDVIVIGSGAGGLASAVALARAGQRVLMLEQHYLPGGWCHSFPLGGFQFSPGVHYIGALEEGQMMRNLFEGLGVAKDLVFCELNPDGYDHVQIGDERFSIPKGVDTFRRKLHERFPRERAGIDRYFATTTALQAELFALLETRGLDALTLPLRLRTLARWGTSSLERFLDACTQDPALRTILSIQAGDYGLAPALAPLPIHAAVTGHYYDGGYYPMGGARSIPKAFIKELRRQGGEIRISTAVARILTVRDGGRRRAVGVRLDDGTELHAPTIVSNADPAITYGELVGEEFLSRRLRRKLSRTRWSVSCLSLFLGVQIDAEAHGLDSGNVWYTRTPSVDATYDFASRRDLRGVSHIPSSFLTVTSLKDPTKRKARDLHTMESFSLISHEAFSQWAHSRYGERPESYGLLKEELTERMLDHIGEFIPNFRDHVVFHELGTPLTNRYYVRGTHGTMYGAAKDFRQIGPFAFQAKGEVRGLYLCGASTSSHGVAGAMMSGLQAAQQVLGVSVQELLAKPDGSLRTVLSDAPATWPADLRRKVRYLHRADAAE